MDMKEDNKNLITWKQKEVERRRWQRKEHLGNEPVPERKEWIGKCLRVKSRGHSPQGVQFADIYVRDVRNTGRLGDMLNPEILGSVFKLFSKY